MATKAKKTVRKCGDCGRRLWRCPRCDRLGCTGSSCPGRNWHQHGFVSSMMIGHGQCDECGLAVDFRS